MEGVGMLLFLCITMLIGSFVAGLVPLALSLSENKMRHITILGAGLLIGTALAVIIPEGIIALYSDSSSHSSQLSHSHGHIHKRSLDDQAALEKFLYQAAENSNIQDTVRNRILSKRTADDEEKLRTFEAMRGETINVNRILSKRHVYSDDEARSLFLFQKDHNNNQNQVWEPSARISKRSLDDERARLMFMYQQAHNNNVIPLKKRAVSRRETASDQLARLLFLYQKDHNNNQNQVIDSSVNNYRVRRDATLSDSQARRMFLLQKDHNNNQNQVYEPSVNNRAKRETDADLLANRHFNLQRTHNNNQNQVDDGSVANLRFRRETEGDRQARRMFLYQQAENNNVNEVLDDSVRVKRAVVNDPNQSGQAKVEAPAKGGAVKEEKEESHEEHGHASEPIKRSHSAIGISLVLGFVFMLIVDQIGGKFSHRHAQILDAQAIRSKVSFVTTLGLVVHAAADGIALGAAAATSKTDVEMIVFAAIMLHKAPAAFGLVSFLMHEGLDRTRVRRHLTIFALAAPLMGILTFLILSAQSDVSVDSNSTGLCMLFSAGTFLYVSTVHVLPEVQSHNEDRQFRTSEMLSFIIGALLPLIMSIGHSH